MDAMWISLIQGKALQEEESSREKEGRESFQRVERIQSIFLVILDVHNWGSYRHKIELSYQ